MPLSVGDKLGPYEILAPIGAGGMGEVYRAHDSRLHRDVAIKVSQEKFSDRFEREARVVAALNHPNICTLYDVGPNYLVMELIEGEPPKGPLPVEKALRIARQIASALDAAHSKGIVHRDLKPANIKVKPDGTIKVLDFGLAKTAEVPAGDPENSPTMTVSPTHAGMIMGTAAYMSPEQARGKSVDKRSDIWAFGVVLYELAVGERPFKGDALTEILASVVKDAPDLMRAPVRLRRLLESCLEKDPRRRLRDIGDAWRLLEEGGIPLPKTSRKWIWAAAAIAVVAVGVAVFAFTRPAPAAEAYRLSVNPPPGVHFEFANDTGGSAISPDGRKLAFVAGGSLWMRPLDSETASRIPGTNGAYCPFWSPDHRSIAFFAGDKLLKIDIATGLVTELATLDAGAGRGGSWNADGTIVYSEILRPLLRISSQGGRPVRLTSLDESQGEEAHYHPSFLPDGDRYLYMVRSRDPANDGIYAGSLKDPKLKKRVATTLSSVGYVAPVHEYPGYLLFYRDGALVAQPFDAKALQSLGDPEILCESVGYLVNNQRANFSVSDTGVVVFGTKGTPKLQMTWLDRHGNATTVPSPADYFSFPRLSPDGSRVVMETGGGTGSNSPRIFDFKRGVLSRVDESGGYPAWSADGRRIIFFSAPAKALVSKDPDSSQPAEIVARLDAATGDPIDWSPDGQFAIVETPRGLAALGVGEHPTTRLLTRGAQDHFPRLSPDGKWLAYHSRQSGKYQVFVQDFSEGRIRTQVSNQGGVVPLWRRDQKELFYLTQDTRLMAVDVKSTTSVLEFGTPHALFAFHNLGGTNLGGTNSCDVTADGQRFLCLFPVEDEARNDQLTVILNWRGGLKR